MNFLFWLVLDLAGLGIVAAVCGLATGAWRPRFGVARQLAEHLPDRLAQQLAPEAVRASVAPLDRPPVAPTPDWDSGHLVLADERLLFCGQREAFLLPRAHVAAVEPGPPLAIRWWDAERALRGWLRIATDHPAALADRLEAWLRETPVEASAINLPPAPALIHEPSPLAAILAWGEAGWATIVLLAALVLVLFDARAAGGDRALFAMALVVVVIGTALPGLLHRWEWQPVER